MSDKGILATANERIEELIGILITEKTYNMPYCLRVTLLDKERNCKITNYDCKACNRNSMAEYRRRLLKKYIITI